ncbi:MAG: DUF1611 domain-containing protein [Acidobacteriota bacterium]|nr:DUF1611 domain-containing protein [Acidobacteriota bacterium]
MDGNAIVYCEGAFGTANGKTAHGLVRRTNRYRVMSVIDSEKAGRDAGEILDRRRVGIPVLADIDAGVAAATERGLTATHLVVGLAPDGGKLSREARSDLAAAIRAGLNVDSGLHDYLTEDPELSELAAAHGVVLRDVRKPPPREKLHFFSGKIEEVTSLKVAALGTDSAVGKRTTAWRLVEACEAAGLSAELVGTGQTAWMQGARFGIVLDSLINDFVTGEIEHAVWRAWKEASPEVIIIEGQGSLMNPAYPGGFEILAAGRPDVVVLQHAPMRHDYDGFPGYPIQPIETQIQAIELISGAPVVAITLNHEGLDPTEIPEACARLSDRVHLPVVDVLVDGADALIEVLRAYMRQEGEKSHD